jgi:methylase of polypeptide subunit release factors
VPTTVSEVIAENLGPLPENAVVIDMGCGSGFFSVLAAKKGAKKVYGVDIMPDAVALTEKNLARNGIPKGRVEVFCGNLFDPLENIKADLVIIDVPGIACRLARLSPWYPVPIAVASEDGSEPTTSALLHGRDHLLPGGSIIFPLLSLADNGRIFEIAQRIFDNNVKLLQQKLLPVTAQLQIALDQCPHLLANNVVSLVHRNRKKYWVFQIYQGQLRPVESESNECVLEERSN